MNGDNLHEMSKLVFCVKYKKKNSVCHPLKILPSLLRVKVEDGLSNYMARIGPQIK